MMAGMRNNASALSGPDGEMRELGNGSGSDEENWSEREASRTHSVKFQDEQQPPEADKEVSFPMLSDASSHSSSTAHYSCNDFISYLITCLLRRATFITCMKRSASYGSLAAQQ